MLETVVGELASEVDWAKAFGVELSQAVRLDGPVGVGAKELGQATHWWLWWLAGSWSRSW